jgi:predicted transcriptional regulator
MKIEDYENARVISGTIEMCEQKLNILRDLKYGSLHYGGFSFDEKVFTAAKKSQIKILQAEIDRLEKEFKAL